MIGSCEIGKAAQGCYSGQRSRENLELRALHGIIVRLGDWEGGGADTARERRIQDNQGRCVLARTLWSHRLCRMVMTAIEPLINVYPSLDW